jgi:hypothetical protein
MSVHLMAGNGYGREESRKPPKQAFHTGTSVTGDCTERAWTGSLGIPPLADAAASGAMKSRPLSRAQRLRSEVDDARASQYPL